MSDPEQQASNEGKLLYLTRMPDVFLRGFGFSHDEWLEMSVTEGFVKAVALGDRTEALAQYDLELCDVLSGGHMDLIFMRCAA